MKQIEIGDWVYDGILRGYVIGECIIGRNIPAYQVNIGGNRIRYFIKRNTELWFKGD